MLNKTTETINPLLDKLAEWVETENLSLDVSLQPGFTTVRVVNSMDSYPVYCALKSNGCSIANAYQLKSSSSVSTEGALLSLASQLRILESSGIVLYTSDHEHFRPVRHFKAYK